MKFIYNVFYIFFLILEVILFAYIIVSFFPQSNRFRKHIIEIANPLIEPVRYLLSHSVFQSNVMDFSPVISYIIINFLQGFFYALL